MFAHHFTQLFTMFGIYMLGVFTLGFISNHLTKNLSDYVLGGRRLSGPVAALGAGASDMSGWLVMALPAAAMQNGLHALWLPIGLTIGAYCNWRYVAKRLRIYTEILNDAVTIPAYFDNRFHDIKNHLRSVTAVVVVIFFTVYAAAGFVSGAVLLNLTTGLNYSYALLISASIFIIYTCIGGFLAINWVDFVQGMLVFIAMIFVPLIATHHLGGWSQVIQKIQNINPALLHLYAVGDFMSVISLLAWGLGYFGQVHILVRFMAVKNPDAMGVARRICISWMVISLAGAFLSGFVGKAFFTPLAGSGPTLNNPETVFLALIDVLFNPWLAAFLMAIVLSVIMSAIAAQLIAASSALSEDFYVTLFRPQAGDREQRWVGRIAVLCIAVIAFWVASNPNTTILHLVGYAWSGVGASFGPVILISLFWVRTTKIAAILGMIVGAATVIVWNILAYYYGGIFELYDIVPAFLLNTITIFLVSHYGKDVPITIQQNFYKMLRTLKHEKISS